MKIDITFKGLQELQADFKDFSERRLRAAVATAMTRTAVAVRSEMQREMAADLDRPNPYTTRNLRYTAATAKSLTAMVGFDIIAKQDMYGNVTDYVHLGRAQTPVGKYMHDQIEGGPRRNKRFELALQRVGVLTPGWFAVPGERAKMDAFGNQSPGEIRQIMSWFDAAELVAGSRQNMRAEGRAKRLKGTRKKAGWEYRLIKTWQTAKRSWARHTSVGPSRGTHKMQPGIYRVTYGPGRPKVEPVMIFVRAASYKARFDFYGKARQAADRIYSVEIDKAIDQARKSMASRAGGGQ